MPRSLAFAAALCAATPGLAQSLKPDEVLSSIAVRPISAPSPVLGADGRTHLAYELEVTNPSSLFMTLDRIEARTPEGASLGAIEGAALAAMIKPFAGEGARLAPGGTGVVFLDVSYPAGTEAPAQVLSRITVTREIADASGKPAPFPASEPVPATVTFDGAAIAPEGAAVVLEPPLRGAGWVAANGCCDSITSHRGAVMSVNGTLRVPERFAIDWVRIGEGGKLYSGDGSKVEDFAYYGTEVLSVAPGVVANVYDEAKTQVPNADPTGINTENIGGNMVAVDIGAGRYAFYAHMQPGSIRVKLGDRVETGQVIGLLGNTGNTTAPHLHFHVMDGPSPLDANGLPYVFRAFKSTGTLGNEDVFETGAAAEVTPRLAGDYEAALPLNDQVVDFE